MYEIINTMSHFVIAGLRGNAGAGGAMLALAADRVYAKKGVVLNPHYRSMGELYGSEYWTYLLPRRVGQQKALELTHSCEPIGTTKACAIGFLDEAFGEDVGGFEEELRSRAIGIAARPELRAMLREKHERRLDDEAIKFLAAYRNEELEKMRVNFFGPDRAYHEARQRSVFKGNPPPSHEPEIARSNVVTKEPLRLASTSHRGRDEIALVGLLGSSSASRGKAGESPSYRALRVRLQSVIERGINVARDMFG